MASVAEKNWQCPIVAILLPGTLPDQPPYLLVLQKVGSGFKLLKLNGAEADKHSPVREEDRKLQWFERLGIFFLESCV
jgi:hypothetical protein